MQRLLMEWIKIRNNTIQNSVFCCQDTESFGILLLGLYPTKNSFSRIGFGRSVRIFDYLFLFFTEFESLNKVQTDRKCATTFFC